MGADLACVGSNFEKQQRDALVVSMTKKRRDLPVRVRMTRVGSMLEFVRVCIQEWSNGQLSEGGINVISNPSTDSTRLTFGPSVYPENVKALASGASNIKMHQFARVLMEQTIAFQFICLSQSIYIWIGQTSQATCNHLSSAINMANEPIATSILGNNEAGIMIASHLTKVGLKVAFVSFNVSPADDLLVSWVEKQIVAEKSFWLQDD